MNRKLWNVFAVVVLCGVAGLVTVGSMQHANFVKKTKALAVNPVDPATVADGTYQGVCDLEVLNATVRVTVKSGRIEEITLTDHRYSVKYPGEGVIPRVKEKQSLVVDAVSGASISSKVVLKAIENALRQGVASPSAPK